jgi:glucose-fructose oxidoreductase
VYIALPNHMHRDYAVRAAAAGVHVLCEKPMATSSRECNDMIDAAQRHDVRLMIAYRLHFDPANLEAAKVVRSGKLGEPRIFSSNFCMQVRPGNIRTEAELGGGPLPDIGIYCLNAARYLFAAEPTYVAATNARASHDPRFREVPEMVSAVLHFPEHRLATFTCSFGAFDTSAYTVIGSKGRLTVDPAYEYAAPLQHVLTIGKKTTKRKFKRSDQFAPELLHFSDCVLTGREPGPSGREGAIDVMIIEAMRQSMRTGQGIKVAVPSPERRPESAQAKHRPPVRRPPRVDVESASLPS